MLRGGRPTTLVVLRDSEEEELRRLVRRSRTNRDLGMRARVVLALSQGKTGQAVMAELHVSPPTVVKWRKRFNERQIEGLFDEPRPGAPRKITDPKVEEAVVTTLESLPEGGRPKTEKLILKLG